MTTPSEEEPNKVQELPQVKRKDRAAGMYTMNVDFEGEGEGQDSRCRAITSRLKVMIELHT
jgi:hypothetical protein